MRMDSINRASFAQEIIKTLMMKKIKLLFILFIGLTMIGTSCKKTEEKETEELLDELLDVKGSINLQAAGNTYDKLFSSVVYSESDKMVSFWAFELGTEDSFIVSFGEVPAVGATATIDYNADESPILLIMGSFMEGEGYYAQSGTIKRTSTDKYELNVILNDNLQTGNPVNLSGTVTVGEHN